MKILLATLMSLLGFWVLFERHGCDVFGLRWPGLHIPEGGKCKYPARGNLFGEAERSLRNALRNAGRNFRNGAVWMLTLVPTEADRLALRRHYRRHLPRPTWTRIGILTIDQIMLAISRRQAYEAQLPPARVMINGELKMKDRTPVTYADMQAEYGRHFADHFPTNAKAGGVHGHLNNHQQMKEEQL